MTLPTRLIQSVRPHASPGVMAGAAVVAATFAATPFLLPDLSVRLEMDIGNTGFLSTAQVGSFALATFLAGRLLRPRRRLHYGSLGLIALATATSALMTTFALLLVTRVIAGLGMGTLTWIAWADATRSPRGIGEVAAIAPVTAAIASPILGWITGVGGYPWVFGSLAVIAVIAALAPVDFGDLPRIGRNVSGSRSNRLLLLGLLVLSVGGSSVFIFTGAAAVAVHDLSPVTVSWALSLNAICGVIATRRTATRRTASLWIVLTAACAIAVGVVASPVVFFVSLAVWGFAFWMAVPEVLKLLTERSLTPSERMGDAQAAMAVGRVIGPVVGAFALGVGLFTRLSLVGAALMTGAAAVIGGVELYRTRSTSTWTRISRER